MTRLLRRVRHAKRHNGVTGEFFFSHFAGKQTLFRNVINVYRRIGNLYNIYRMIDNNNRLNNNTAKRNQIITIILTIRTAEKTENCKYQMHSLRR